MAFIIAKALRKDQDDPDRLRATAAALAAPVPPDPEALGERERRGWRMLFAQLLGTGPHWRPLAEALALLWAMGAWREELRQLLELLAERAEVLAAFDAVDERSAPRSHRAAVSPPRGAGGTEPFVCLDFARYEGHVAEGFCAAVGERPLAWPLRGWRLEREIPAVWMHACCVPTGRSSPSLALAV